jgi:hypothetical protein
MLFDVQVVPELVETHIAPISPLWLKAANLLPSAEAETEYQLFVGAPVGVHVWANTEFTAVDSPQRIIATGSRVFIWRLQLLNHFLNVLPSDISASN